MRECRRIFSNRRLWIFIVVIYGLNCFLFIREQSVRDYGMDLSLDVKSYQTTYQNWLELYKRQEPEEAIISLQKEETELLEMANLTEKQYSDLIVVRSLLGQFQYQKDFYNYLLKIQNNKDSALSFSIFNLKNDFTRRNIIKTASQFEALREVEITIDNNHGLDAFFAYRTSDYFLLLFLVMIVFTFLDERKKGLWCIVYGSKDGRIKLGARRISILLGASVVGTFLLYGSVLLLANYLYGGFGDFNRAIQSSELFMKLPMRVTVGEFLILFFFMRMVTAFFISLICWLLVSLVSNLKYTLAVLILIFAIEYLMFTFLPVQSGFNLLKYFNLFTYINLSELYTNYLNINIFQYPVGIRKISFIGMIPMGIFFLIGILSVCARKKPMFSSSRLNGWELFVQRRLDDLRRGLHLFGFEGYKVLFIQKGILVLIFGVWLVSGFTFLAPVKISSQKEEIARQYTILLEDELGDELETKVAKEQNKITQLAEAYETAKNAYQSGKIDYAELNMVEMDYEAAIIQQQGLDLVKERIAELDDLQEKIGHKLWLIDETAYNRIWGKDGETSRQTAAMAAIFILALLLAGVFSYEKQSGASLLLSSTMRGRIVLLRNKFAISGCLTIVVWAVVYGWETGVFFRTYPLLNMEVPIQSLNLFAKFPLLIDVGTFYVLLSFIRLVMLFSCSCLMLLLSSIAAKVESAILLCMLCILPAVMGEILGFPLFRVFSLSRAVSMVEILSDGGTIVTCMLMCAMSVFCLLILWKKSVA